MFVDHLFAFKYIDLKWLYWGTTVLKSKWTNKTFLYNLSYYYKAITCTYSVLMCTEKTLWDLDALP